MISALPPKADIHRRERHVRFVPIADIRVAPNYFRMCVLVRHCATFKFNEPHRAGRSALLWAVLDSEGAVMNYRNLAAKIGAVFYVLWGIYHLPAANSVYKLAEGTSGMVQGRLLQNAFYILFFAISGIVIALAFNWRNDRQGYWMNGIGPLLWIVAFVFTTVGRFGLGSSAAARADI